MNVTPIANPLPGEHLAGTSPTLRPETDAGWQQRLNFWPGRALTAEALELEQENRAARLATWARVGTSGIVAGLEVALEAPPGAGSLTPNNHFLHVQPGHGISATGEDIVVPRPLRVELDNIAVQLARYTELETLPPGNEDVLIDLGNSRLRVHTFHDNYVPWAAVLVLRPAEVRQFGKLDPTDPCELDPSRDPFADERRLDSALFRLVVLPSKLRHHPLLSGATNEPRWRNRLAHVVFSTEAADSARQYLRYFRSHHAKDRWETWLAAGGIFPWEMLGVPLALFSIERVPATGRRRYFLDRATVARPGGRARPRTRLAARMATGDPGMIRPPGNGTPALWRARVDQFAEHLSALDTAVPEEQAERFQFLPPAGLLPRAALDFLTTEQALLLPPPPPGINPDRAAVSHFFPEDYLLEAVPTVLEDLDAALAASAPMEPFDFEQADLVRMLVPVPQRAFDPRLLVVELEDPLFRAELARLYALRQDWRQRRDYVLGRRDDLQQLIRGGPRRPRVDPGQTEPEPVETLSSIALPCALIPPKADGPWKLPITFSVPHVAGQLAALRVQMHFDEGQPPATVELRWRVAGGREISDVWNVMPPLTVADSALEPNGVAVAASLWRVFSKTPAQLGLTALEQITGVTIVLSGGRAAIGRISALENTNFDRTLFRPIRPATEKKLPPHGWPSVANALLRAPFEGRYRPAPADGLNFEDHLDALAPLFEEFDEELRKLDPRLQAPLHIHAVGLERLLTLVERETNKADETVDLAFERVQAHLQRVRAVMLGEEEAEEAQSSPAVASLIKATKARVPAGKLGERMSIDPSFTKPPNVANIKVVSSGERLASTATATVAKRKLNFTRRFHYGEVYAAYESLRACLLDVLKSLSHLKVGFDDGDLPEVEEVIDPVTNVTQPVRFSTLRLANVAFYSRLQVRNFAQEQGGNLVDQSGEILSKAIHRGNIILLVLRKVEEYIVRRRELLARGEAALAAAREQVRAANVRLGLLDPRLAETRHDVGVARALRQEERDRIAAINHRRDAIIRDEVRFLAYVRPRAIDPVRRALPSWRLEASGTLAPVPACLQKHDEPPDPLRAYVQLFRHSPARWFTNIGPRLRELNTKEKLIELLGAARRSALDFTAERRIAFSSPGFAAATQTVLRSSYSLIERFRTAGAALQVPRATLLSWENLLRDAEQHASLRDIIAGRHGHAALARAAADELELVEQVATCLHAEFAAVAPATRLLWVERYSEFDKPSPLRDLTALPRFGSLPRAARRRFQAFVDWLFGRVNLREREAFNLINDLVRLCLLLASHAPVKKLIAGHVPRPVPARPGALIPIRPINPAQVRVGMEFHVWQASTIVARGRVEDLRDGEVSARVERAQTATTMIDQTMRVQFIAPALGFAVQFAQR